MYKVYTDRTCILLKRSEIGTVFSSTSTSNNSHSRQHCQLNSFTVIKIQHFKVCHTNRCTTRPRVIPNYSGLRNMLYNGRVTRFAKSFISAFPSAVIGVIAKGSNDEIPSKIHKVHGQGIPTTCIELILLITVNRGWSLFPVILKLCCCFDFKVWLLENELNA